MRGHTINKPEQELPVNNANNDPSRRRAIPGDPAERATGADIPNDGGVTRSPGGPKNAPKRVPGQDRDPDATTSGSKGGNDPQRDSQI